MRKDSPKLWKFLQIIAWAYVLVVGGITAYGNNFYPHGPAIPTGDVVCENDDRGPCHETSIEDTRNLNVPDWVKYERDNESAIFLSLLAAAIFAFYAGSKREELEGLR